MQKLPLSQLYKLIDKAVTSYDRRETENTITMLRWQVSTYYRRLRNILLPVMHNGRVLPPMRWEEPLIQHYVKSYLKVMSQLGQPKNDHIESDPVYSGILNPDVRQAILQRRMDEKTYRRIERLLKKTERKQLLLGGSTSKALTTAPPGKLAPYKEIDRRLDNQPPELLTIESGLNKQSVNRWLDHKLTGSQIVDLAFTARDKESSTSLVHRLMTSEVDDWPTVIDVARDIGCTANLILRIMREVGTTDVEEVVGMIEDAHSEVAEFAEKHRMNLQKAWYIFFMIYIGNGSKDICRSLALFSGRFFHNWNEDNGQYEDLL